jgi:triacylglycerol esterase/lipase EstA (alpha/beta hydrolase family)
VLAGLAPARRRLILAVLALVAAGLVIAGTLVFTRTTGTARTTTPAAQLRPGPVLLVPGYGGATGGLHALADRLSAAGRDATVVALPGNGTGDLGASANALGVAVSAALARTGDRSVDLVGYSAGGIVVRLWVADGHADVVRRVVTLGSPHHGTSLADLAASVAPAQCPLACAQLTTNSAVLARLNAGDETPAGPTWVSIWTTQDTTVTPPDSARLAGALNLPVQSVCGRAQITHGDLPTAPLVQQMVLSELGAGPPAALGAADCASLSG